MAGRCLIVANQTLGGDALGAAVRECLERDVHLFYVVVPITRVEHETPGWGGGFVLGEEAFPATVHAAASENERRLEENARRRQAQTEEARRRAEQRLHLMIERIQKMGGKAEGETGTHDPLEATRAVLQHQAPFDEIIVSTLPSGVSRWLKMSLPARVARLTRVPVTTVEAEPE